MKRSNRHGRGSGAGSLLTLLDELVTALGQQLAEMAQPQDQNRELRRPRDATAMAATAVNRPGGPLAHHL